MNHMTPEVICIGQAVIDCITREMDRAPFSEGKARAKSITLNAGGDAMNESCVLAGMGRRVELVCGTGDDFAGQYLRDQARQKGVGTDRIQVVPGIQTPVANMFVAADGSRSSVSSLATLLEGYIPDPGDLQGVRVLSLASLFRAPLDQAEIVCGLVRAVHEAGAVVCADCKLPTFRQMKLEELGEVLPMIDYFFPNETEAACYSGKEDLFDMGETLLQRGFRHVIIKAGERGCLVFGDGKPYELPAIEVPVVDTTGAGDNFVAGFIDGLLRGFSVKECCRAGLEQAALSVQHVGAT